jgi:predicted nucleic acid-binding protein
MIHLDTSVLIDALCGDKSLAPGLRQLFDRGERVFLSTLVLFEWLRGPRISEQIAAQQALFPPADAILFGPAEASLAAALYRKVKRGRGREIDIAIAACSITHEAELWTVNPEDFTDIPNLKLRRFEAKR